MTVVVVVISVVVVVLVSVVAVVHVRKLASGSGTVWIVKTVSEVITTLEAEIERLKQKLKSLPDKTHSHKNSKGHHSSYDADQRDPRCEGIVSLGIEGA